MGKTEIIAPLWFTMTNYHDWGGGAIGYLTTKLGGGGGGWAIMRKTRELNPPPPTLPEKSHKKDQQEYYCYKVRFTLQSPMKLWVFPIIAPPPSTLVVR